MEQIAQTEPDTAGAHTVAPGYCECGCGQQTNLATRTRRDRGWIKGQALRRVRGHSRRKRERHNETDTGYPTPCWIWKLAKNQDGYGRVRNGNRMALAHRVYYEQRHGPVPDGTELDHVCRTPCCVNPDHLEPVSHAENCRRGERAKLTSSQVAEIRGSSDTQRVIARRFGISQSQVSRIRKGQSWR